MIMKKVLVVLLAVALGCSMLVACGDENALPEDAGTLSVTESAADSALDDTSESDAETETEEEKAEAETGE